MTISELMEMKTPAEALKVLERADPRVRAAVVFILRHVAADQACEWVGPQAVLTWAADEIEGKQPEVGG